MNQIHPSAIIEDGAQIGEGCVIGPFSIVGPEVTLGNRVRLKSHVVVTGMSEIGDETEIHPFSVIGDIPQDKKFKGEKSRLVVGKRNRIRESVTMNAGTEGGGGVTRIGDDCLFMAGVHVAHDCQIGDRVIMVNNAAAAGHCIIGDDVIIGGISGLHQWVRIGRGAIIGGLTPVAKDVIPYGLVHAPRGDLEGLNLVGLRRRGVARDDIAALRAAFSAMVKDDGPMPERAKRLAATTDNPLVQEIVDFVMGGTDRHILTPKG